MKHLFILLIAELCLFNLFAQQKITYPETRTGEVEEDYFGTTVKDPYRWLEDDNSEETMNWVTIQNKTTELYLTEIPYRKYIHKQLTNLWDYETKGIPSHYNNFTILTKNDGKQNHSVYYITGNESDEEEVLLDPNTLSEDGSIAVKFTSVSKDEKYLAYGISESGSDWTAIRVMEIATKKLLSDHIQWVKFSGVSWHKNGFYYSGYAPPKAGKELAAKNEFHKVYYHELGSEQKKDKIIFESQEHPTRNFGARVSEDEKFLIVSASEGTSGNIIYVKHLEEPTSEFIQFIENFDNETSFIGNEEDKLFFITNYNAPNKKIVFATIEQSSPEQWEELIPEKEYVIENVSIAGDKLFVNYLKDVQSKIEAYSFDGELLTALTLPEIGIAGRVSGKRNQPTAYFTFSSYISPTKIYQVNLEEVQTDLYFEPRVDFKTGEYVTKQVFYESKDGTKIPMFISHKKDIELNGKNPCMLYAYGGFNISVKPTFDVSKAVFMQNGGIYAVANIRGGSEYGEEWHKAGMLENKQNVFDDFIAAANFLKEKKYTSTEKLAIHGRSNGGLLIGAVMTQQPDIAKVAIPMVGVLDMLRYHEFTIGWAWAVEYGSSENEEQFQYLYKYSPLHNLKKAAYPATMIITGDHDDRVVPAHSFKFGATLQQVNAGKNPTLIRIDTQGGHGAGKSKAKLIQEWTDIWSFVFYNLDMKPVNFK
ncbi:MAG: prolyl oligopeptidase family serine peptidase [Vicingaceae bacterium]|nr:prolyl oligopeptidase family serine peptidase [Vicingaceae bacterium]